MKKDKLNESSMLQSLTNNLGALTICVQMDGNQESKTQIYVKFHQYAGCNFATHNSTVVIFSRQLEEIKIINI